MTKVLLCSERYSDQEIIEAFFKKATRRYDLIWAPSCYQATQVFRQEEIDVCILDSQLGVTCGVELMTSLFSTGQRIPVIVLLDEDDPKLEISALRSGAAGLIVRSDMTVRILERAIRHSIERTQNANLSSESPFPYAILPFNLVCERLELAQVRARRNHAGCAVLAIAYEVPMHLRGVVEGLGISFLAPLVERIRGCIGANDTVFRTGMYELCAVVEMLFDPRASAEIAGRVLSAMNDSFFIKGDEIQLAGQIGVSVYPDHSTKTETLIALAREAVHAPTDGKRNQVRMYRSVRPAPEIHYRRSDIRRSLVGAHERGELILHYQPQIDIVRNVVVGAEGLMRWISPQFGVISPNDFIPIAEELGIIEDLGEWAIHEVCSQGKKWLDAGINLRMGVNVSARQFHIQARKITDIVKEALRHTCFPAHCLEIEITEGILLENTNANRALLEELRAAGVLIAVDDFGAGYASLSYVKRFPMDVIKIDREFVRNLPNDAQNAAITSSIMALAQCLHIEVIAEGVEDEAEEEYLRTLGCRVVQGYRHGKPMNPKVFEHWYEQRMQPTSGFRLTHTEPDQVSQVLFDTVRPRAIG